LPEPVAAAGEEVAAAVLPCSQVFITKDKQRGILQKYTNSNLKHNLPWYSTVAE
jgi:hypothetical protein